MNILVFGAGAIGSLFGGLLATQHEVTLLGRHQHIQAIKADGLHITGCTSLHVNVNAVESSRDIIKSPDLILLTVKSYDTKKALKLLPKLLAKNTILVSMQNGLCNLPILTSALSNSQIFGGVTAHGALFEKPGWINHTGCGYTVLGSPNKSNNQMLELSKIFTDVGIESTITDNIYEELWKKAIINACINPISSIFGCRNGYLLENPLLKPILLQVCQEATAVAQAEGYQLSIQEIRQCIKQVIKNTQQNYSSMLQSILQHKPTEIDAITGEIINKSKSYRIEVPLNTVLYETVKLLEKAYSHS